MGFHRGPLVVSKQKSSSWLTCREPLGFAKRAFLEYPVFGLGPRTAFRVSFWISFEPKQRRGDTAQKRRKPERRLAPLPHLPHARETPEVPSEYGRRFAEARLVFSCQAVPWTDVAEVGPCRCHGTHQKLSKGEASFSRIPPKSQVPYLVDGRVRLFGVGLKGHRKETKASLGPVSSFGHTYTHTHMPRPYFCHLGVCQKDHFGWFPFGFPKNTSQKGVPHFETDQLGG